MPAACSRNLRVVIVDEIHAFAGDDRGWHLLSVLQRITRLAGRELQRIGLSATVGNPEMLIDWLAGPCKGERVVFRPAEAAASQAEVKLDFVGSLENAAVVISRLHRGEKRLVFVDSRARAEELGAGLRQLGITAFVTHSSLSQEQRRQAEDAFANRDDCVIVATSVLELGVDVGNLDRVIQIDSPTTVSSFLQRMGRTGRRPGSVRNCLFLATRDETLVQAAGLIDLWHEGYVEPIQPPAGAVPRPGAAAHGPGPSGTGNRQIHLAGVGRGRAGVRGHASRSVSRKSSHGCSPRGCSGRSRASWGSGRRARRPTGGGTSWSCSPSSSPRRCSPSSTVARNWGSWTN